MKQESQSSERIVLEMSEGPPVRIRPDVWKLIVDVSHPSKEHFIHVRQHEDGRRIVYGETTTDGNSKKKNAGFLLGKEDDTVRGIKRVAGLLHLGDLVETCIRQLPARDL